jgi:hypothetical protein
MAKSRPPASVRLEPERQSPRGELGALEKVERGAWPLSRTRGGPEVAKVGAPLRAARAPEGKEVIRDWREPGNWRSARRARACARFGHGPELRNSAPLATATHSPVSVPLQRFLVTAAKGRQKWVARSPSKQIDG